MSEWRTVTQAFSALDNSEPPALTAFTVGERIRVRTADDTYVRFSREPDSEQEFYAPYCLPSDSNPAPLSLPHP